METAKEIIQIGIGLFTLIGLGMTVFLQFRNARRLLAVEANVEEVHRATNSMKDALVASTERSAGLAGEERGRLQERSDQLTRAEPLAPTVKVIP